MPFQQITVVFLQRVDLQNQSTKQQKIHKAIFSIEEIILVNFKNITRFSLKQSTNPEVILIIPYCFSEQTRESPEATVAKPI
jgi:hypothetical protein